jgi:xanthine dehydrogenase YagS FAD-binding subunit
VTEETAAAAAEAALEGATPLSQNAYKIQVAKTAVKRAILRAAGIETV